MPVSQLSSPVRIRRATPADKSPVLEFCRNTWPGGDYIPEVWDDWIRDARGRLVVATVNGSPVGMAHATLQTRSVAWLEGVRVHPSYRGRGIAGKLNIALTRFAAEKGATVARLCTGSMNKASQRHLDKVGFQLLQRFQRFHSVKPLTRQPSGVVRPRKYEASMWKWLVSRREFEQSKGMYSDGWTWYPLTSKSLQRFLSERGVLSARSKMLTSCSIFTREEGQVTLGFAAGPPEEIRDQAKYLRYLLSKGGYEKIRVLVPARSRLIDAFEDAGYEKSGTILVYEKPLRVKPGLQKQ